MSPRRPWLLLAPVLLLAGLALVGRVPAHANPPIKWEHRLLVWKHEDTEALLREATGQALASIEEMAHMLERGNEPLDDPRVQAIVDRVLQQKLDAAGKEGWEAFQVLTTRSVVYGVLLPAPRVVLKRPAQ